MIQPLTPKPESPHEKQMRRRRVRRRRRFHAVRRALPSALLVGAVTIGAFWGGRFLRQAAEGSGAVPAAAGVPLASSLAQVAENGAAHGGGHGKTGQGDNGDSGGNDTFETVYALVKEHYVDEVPSDSVLASGAVRSLLQSLNDPNSQFLEPSQRALVENEAKGKFGGIGSVLSVQAQKQNGYTEYKLVVVAPLPGSPAEMAGLRTGDVITHVNGKWVLGYDPFLKASKLAQKVQSNGGDTGTDEAIVRQTYDAARAQTRGGIGLFAAQMLLKGDAKTLAAQKSGLPGRVTLTVQRGGVGLPLTVSVPLKETLVESGGVQSKPLGPNAGYIKISTLTTSTAPAFQKAIADVPHTNGLVLDLRNNGGGLIESAQAIDAALFSSPEGSKSGKNAVPFGYEVTGHTRRAMPLLLPASAGASGKNAAGKIVVLVNGGTAGAAESLASALSERHGAILAGQRTFGDASVQTLYPLPDGSAFTLTTGQWLSGHKISWAGRGLTPRFAATPLSQAKVSESGDPLKQALRLLQSPPLPVRHAAAPRTGKAKEHGL